ncbi:retron system putative HNH endonuclease [Thiomicrospira sp. ALE5]|uniref:retron system putative HNH endonuclease n=1 Tax=Thiomicrospira sp. ALE5 TaxID=748650 RepID=UPI0008EFECBC|nr:retron system putative HNH endonuclease [Thiomicrospira sp. ALE5]SFR52575.1 TIGR02646 family protein [Thiomicrospira sp. ALE5]
MRFINKQGTGEFQLNRSNQTPPATREDATSRWGSFGYKADLLKILTAEQQGLCAYSELDPAEFGLQSHIEHVEPKSQYPQRTFDYHNLVMSALGSDDLKLSDVDLFAGHAKQERFEPNLFISPLNSACQDYFVYLSDGRVIPNKRLNKSEREKAEYTIALLNLNCAYLKNKRKNWIDELEELIDQHIEENWSLHYLEQIYLEPCNEKLYSFFSANQQRFAA